MLITLLAFPSAGNSQPALDPAYHDLPEIRSELMRLFESEPNLMTIDTIGYGQENGLPIWLVKLSDNPDRTEAEPALLFVGQIHAEEVIGVEIVLELMKLLVENQEEEIYRRRLEGLELYFIPTLNPDGLEIVHSNIDVTFRKNCRDNVGDGVFRYQREIGRDTSGVDLNRNFGLHWDRGDSLFFNPGADDAYNYYRGASPFSESETQALRNLMLSRRFLYAISYHGSRSGRNAELVIGPWSWGGRRPPNDEAIFELGTALANRIPRQRVQGNYTPVRATMRVGQEQDWAYQTTGCMMYMIEAGAEVQPDSANLRQVINDNLGAAFYLMDLALGDTIPNGQGILSVTVRDSANGEPLPAEIWFGPEPSTVLAPLTCDTANGRFDRLLVADDYELHIRNPGYSPFVLERCEIPDAGYVSMQLSLPRLPIHKTTFVIIDDSTSEPLSARLSIFDDRGGFSDDVLVDSESELELPQGFYSLLFRAEGYVPQFENLEVSNNSSDTIRLTRGHIAYAEDFDVNLNWQQGGMLGEWQITDRFNRTCLTESKHGDYLADSEPWLMLETEIELAPNHRAVVELIHIPYFEPSFDFGSIEAYDPAPNGVWLPLVSFSCFSPEDWDTTYIDLQGLGLENAPIRLRFHIDSDAIVEEDGWLIDRIAIHYSNYPLAVSEDKMGFPSQISLAAYPSPTNGSVSILLDLPEKTEGYLRLFDGLGREVKTLSAIGFSKGNNRFAIDAGDLPSGNYYIQFHGGGNYFGIAKTTSFLLLR